MSKSNLFPTPMLGSNPLRMKLNVSNGWPQRREVILLGTPRLRWDSNPRFCQFGSRIPIICVHRPFHAMTLPMPICVSGIPLMPSRYFKSHTYYKQLGNALLRCTQGAGLTTTRHLHVLMVMYGLGGGNVTRCKLQGVTIAHLHHVRLKPACQSERGKKTRWTKEQERSQHQGTDKHRVWQDPEGSDKQGQREKIGCKVIGGSPSPVMVMGMKTMRGKQRE